MAKKTIPEKGSDEDVTLSEDESIVVEICKYCNTNPCACKRMICPIHGNVRGIQKDSEDFNCEVQNCKITRKQNELEV